MIHTQIDENVNLVYVEEGSIKILTKKNINILNRGDSFFINSNDPSIIYNLEETSKIIVLEIDSEFFISKSSMLKEKITSTKIYGEELGDYLYSIISYNNKNYFDLDKLIKSSKKVLKLIDESITLNNIFYAKELSNNRAFKEKESVVLSMLEKVYDTINNGEDISLKILSEEFNLSYSYMSKMFKEVTGESFSKYITKYKLKRACMLLNNTNYKIAKIANDSGFYNTRSLNRVFKDYLRTTPTEYRKAAN